MNINDPIQYCLQNQETYKKVKDIKAKIQSNDNSVFQSICQAIYVILNDKDAPPMSKLLSLRLAKDCMDQHNSSFAEYFSKSPAFLTIAQIGRFQKQSQSEDRGKFYFSQNPTKEQQTIGNSFLRITLEAIRVWARWYPITKGLGTSKFYEFYANLVQEKVAFPKHQYFKDEDIIKYTDLKNFFEPSIESSMVQSEYLDLKPVPTPQRNAESQPEPTQQQQSLQIQKAQLQKDEPTPTPDEDSSKQIVLQQSQQLQVASKQVKVQLVQVCSNSPPTGDYPLDLLNPIIDAMKSLMTSMDETMDRLLSYELDDEASNLIEENEQLLNIQTDYKKIAWGQFRKKYLGGFPDEYLKKEQELARKQQLEAEEKRKKEQMEEEQRQKQIQLEQQRIKQLKEEEERKKKQKEEELRQQQILEQQKQLEIENKRQEQLNQQRLLQQNEEEERQRQLKIQEQQLKKQKEEEERQKQLKLIQQQEEEQRQRLQKQKEKEEAERQKKKQREEEEKQNLLRQEQLKQQQLSQEEKRKRQKELEEEEKKKIQKQQDDQRLKMEMDKINEMLEEQRKLQEKKEQELKKRLNQTKKLSISEQYTDVPILHLQIQLLQDEKNLLEREVKEYKDKFINRDTAYHDESRKRKALTSELTILREKYEEIINQRDKNDIAEELVETKGLLKEYLEQLKEQIQLNCDLEKDRNKLEIRNDEIKQQMIEQILIIKGEKLHLDERNSDLKETIEQKDRYILELEQEKTHIEKTNELYQGIVQNCREEMLRVLEKYNDIIKRPKAVNEKLVQQLNDVLKSNKELIIKMKQKTEQYEIELLEISKQYNFEMMTLRNQNEILENQLQDANQEIEQKSLELQEANLQIKNLTTLLNMKVQQRSQKTFTDDNLDQQKIGTQESFSSKNQFSQNEKIVEEFKTKEALLPTQKMEVSKPVKKMFQWPEPFKSNLNIPNKEEIKFRRKPLQIMTESERNQIYNPFSTAEEYYANKKQKPPKGFLRQYTDLNISLKKESRFYFKMRCLSQNLGILYFKEKDVKVGFMNSLNEENGLTFLRFGIFIQNISNKTINGLTIQYDQSQCSIFLCKPENIKQYVLQSQQLLSQEIIIEQKEVNPIEINIQYNGTTIELLLPHVISKYIIFNQISTKNFKQKWNALIPNIIRTDIFAFNQQIMESGLDLLNYFSMTIMNESQLNNYWQGIDECKLVSQCRYIDMEFLLKIEVRPDKKMIIQIGFGQLRVDQKKSLQKILNTLQFLLMNE